MKIIRGIPTTYRGINMRSRTEARVAAFFDELDWEWEYEPDDLNYYIPDFVLHLPRADVLVEVKSSVEDIAEAKTKLELSGWEKEAIIVSRGPGLLSAGDYVIGNLLEAKGPERPGHEWHLAVTKFCISCGRVTFISDSNSWHCRHCGADDGNAHIGDFDPREAWKNATNRVQWRPE